MAPRPANVLDGNSYVGGKASASENRVRQYFEAATQVAFPTVKIVASGKVLELDGFSEYYWIGMEYNGEHHYRFNPYRLYNKTKIRTLNPEDCGKINHDIAKHYQAWVRGRENDRIKKNVLGANLIVIPYTVNRADEEAYVYSRLHDLFEGRRTFDSINLMIIGQALLGSPKPPYYMGKIKEPKVDARSYKLVCKIGGECYFASVPVHESARQA